MMESRGTNTMNLDDNDTLIARWVSVDLQLRLQQDIKGRIEMELERRMRQDGATAIAHPTVEVTLKAPSPIYDQDKLLALAELVPPEEFGRGYTLPYTETVVVPARFDMTIVKAWRKYGTAVTDIIEAARLPSLPSKLRIRPKPEKAGGQI